MIKKRKKMLKVASFAWPIYAWALLMKVRKGLLIKSCPVSKLNYKKLEF
jgi:hypothetical protein